MNWLRAVTLTLSLLVVGCAARTYTVAAGIPDDLRGQREAIAAWLVARGYGLEYRATPEGHEPSVWTSHTGPSRRTRHMLHARRQAGEVEDALAITLESGPWPDLPRLSVEAATWRLLDSVRLSHTAVSSSAREDARALVAAFRSD